MSKQKKSTSIYQEKEFKELQLEWYKKLDDDGFQDIERSGRNKQNYFDEYNGILHRSSVNKLYQKIDSFTFTYYNILRKFSHFRGDLTDFLPKKVETRATCPTIEGKSPTCPTIEPNPGCTNSKKPHKPIKLSNSDRRILQMFGDGETMQDISKHLRRYHAASVDQDHKRGRKGKPYSIYYVHKRLKLLAEAAIAWHNSLESLELEDGGGLKYPVEPTEPL